MSDLFDHRPHKPYQSYTVGDLHVHDIYLNQTVSHSTVFLLFIYLHLINLIALLQPGKCKTISQSQLNLPIETLSCLSVKHLLRLIWLLRMKQFAYSQPRNVC